MIDFTFVILHYLTYEDTKECIDSIKNNVKYDNYHIVVVDNASSNNSGIKLKKEYDNDKKVTLLKNSINLGFAKGNNVGYKYAKDVLQSSFICMINNDTIIKQSNFIDEILDFYNTERFDILGPDIISIVDHQHQNPIFEKVRKKKNVRNIIISNLILYLMSFFYLDLVMENLINMLKKLLKPSKEKVSKKKQDKFLISKVLKNIKLHGSCLIFSPDYVNSYNGLYDKTFMYLEEDILFYLSNINNLVTVFYPKVKIYHKEDSSTNYLLNNGVKKRRFVYKNSFKSGLVFMKLMKSVEK
jgi:GT2 family glycosyltransferase